MMSQLNPNATPYVPVSRALPVEAFGQDNVSRTDCAEKSVVTQIVEDSEKLKTGEKLLGQELPESISVDYCNQHLGKLNISESSSNEYVNTEMSSTADNASAYTQDDPSFTEYVAHLVESIVSMCPDVPVDCILEALKANAFNVEMTVSMIYDLWYDGSDVGPQEEAHASSSAAANP